MTYLDMGWTFGGVAHSLEAHKWAHYQSWPQITEQLNSQHVLVVLVTFSGSESCPTGMEGMCHSSSQPPYIKVCLCTWQATASDKRYEKTWVWWGFGHAWKKKNKKNWLVKCPHPFCDINNAIIRYYSVTITLTRSCCVCQCTQTCLNSAVYSK